MTDTKNPFVNYEDVATLGQRLRWIQKNAPKLVDKYLHEVVGPELVKEMKNRAPVDTGNLKASIRQENVKGGVKVGPYGVEYNQYVVEGTKPHVIKAKPGKTLAFKIGGKQIFTKSVNHPGTKPNPYMAQSAEAIMKRLVPKLTGVVIDLKKASDRG